MTEQEHIKNIQRNIIKMHYKAKKPHVGSALSCVRILYNIYFNMWKEGDKVILSKSHGATALYATLAEKELMPIEMLDTYSEEGSILLGHCGYHPLYHLDYCGGSLGMGLSYGIGQALAYPDNYIYVILGDGELDEGNIYEAFSFLNSNDKLNNLSIYIDMNKYQGYKTFRGKNLFDLNFYSHSVNTKKGYGISFLEDTFESHYKILTEEEYNKAMEELK